MNYYKVIIADDNPLIRQSLVKTIHWEQCHCKIPEEAENGIQEKDLIERLHPDIIITDIRMPGMGGLEVIEYIQKYDINAKVIVITGYNEFEYAHKALKLGVFDFILKPIRNEELEDILCKAVTQLDKACMEQERQKRLTTENNTFKEIIQDTDEIFKNQLLLKLAQGQVDNEEILQRLEKDSTIIKKKYVYVIGRLRSMEESICLRAITLLHENLQPIHEECRFLESRVDREVELVFLCNPMVSASIFNIQVKKKLLAVNKILQENAAVTICFAVSNISEDIARLYETRVQARKVLENNYFSTQEEVLFFRHYNLFEMNEGDIIIQDLDYFCRTLEDTGVYEAENEIKDMLDSIVKNTQGNEFQIKCFLSEICITLYRHYNLGKLPQCEYDNNINAVLSEINHLQGIESAKTWLAAYVNRLHVMADPLKQYSNPLVGNAVQYLKTNYRNQDITLISVAEAISVNASYLSRLLKKETGMNFSDILTGVRINKAKQLLEEPGSRAAEVGRSVGYKDYTYFYQVFRKTEGVSPTEYKKMIHTL